MKELREFIKNLKRLEYSYVSLGELFGDEDAKLINLKDILSSVKKLGVKEVVVEYFESFEFITNDGRYIEIVGVY